ncbi:MAG: hypothetical protein M3P48_03280 [Actinomycetota bacterium]|nr:hypothetical protein [Actinomycetota bacterium]
MPSGTRAYCCSTSVPLSMSSRGRRLAVSERGGGLEQPIETTASEEFCRGCGAAARLHARHPTWVRDLPAVGGR